jgi:hypothetical protein
MAVGNVSRIPPFLETVVDGLDGELLDHLGGLEQHPVRDGEPESLGGPEVDREVEALGPFNGQVRPCPAGSGDRRDLDLRRLCSSLQRCNDVADEVPVGDDTRGRIRVQGVVDADLVAGRSGADEGALREAQSFHARVCPGDHRITSRSAPIYSTALPRRRNTWFAAGHRCRSPAGAAAPG